MLRLCNTKEFLKLEDKPQEAIKGYGPGDYIVRLLNDIIKEKIETLDNELDSRMNHELPACDNRLSYLLGSRKELRQVSKLLEEVRQ